MTAKQRHRAGTFRELDVVTITGTIIEDFGEWVTVEIADSEGRGVAFPDVPKNLLTRVPPPPIRLRPIYTTDQIEESLLRTGLISRWSCLVTYKPSGRVFFSLGRKPWIAKGGAYDQLHGYLRKLGVLA